jgi:hypothetical protein
VNLVNDRAVVLEQTLASLNFNVVISLDAPNSRCDSTPVRLGKDKPFITNYSNDLVKSSFTVRAKKSKRSKLKHGAINVEFNQILGSFRFFNRKFRS